MSGLGARALRSHAAANPAGADRVACLCPPRARSENSTSQLQLNSILYRFHPSVLWNTGFPQRDEILSQIAAVWRRYNLQEHTRFGVSGASALP